MKLLQSLPLSILIGGTLLLLIVAGPSGIFGSKVPTKALHFDDICGGGGEDDGNNNGKKSSSKLSSVILKRDDDEELINDGPCICFSVGVYEYHSKNKKICGNPHAPVIIQSNAKIFHVRDKPTCVHLPAESRAFRKLQQEDSPIAASSVPLHSHFKQCHGNNGNVLVRRKRQGSPPAAPAAPAAAGGGGAAPPAMTTKLSDQTDEDFLNTGTEIGHELLRNQMNQYMETVISKLTGLSGEGGADKSSKGRQYPAFKMLDYIKKIFQKTCAPISPDITDLALNSFLNLQTETFHIKEPYIGYATWKRFQQTLGRCLERAHPSEFIHTQNTTESVGDAICSNRDIYQVSEQVYMIKTQESTNLTVPPYAKSMLSDNKYAEPLIEIVWKMIVFAHSYCFGSFYEYFNDHHTFTVSLLPLFTNGIQDIWLNGGEGYDLSEGNKLYGGMLGNVSKLLHDLDWCTASGRAEPGYPWYMNRPTRDQSNEWRRKKRDVVSMETEEEVEEEVESVRGRMEIDDYVLVHQCKQVVEGKDVC